MTLTVNVEQKHIDKGDQCECDTCPVALALLDAGCDDVSVTYYYIDFTYKDEARCIATPDHIENFINDFDDGKDVKPFSF